MKYCIIGAGPAGLAAAYRLQELGEHDFVVLERTGKAGGLAGSVVDSAGWTWDYGVHVCHSHYDYVDKLLPSLLPNGYLQHVRRSWVHMDGRFIPYPFQYNVHHLSEEKVMDCIDGLLELLTHVDQPETFENFGDFCIGRMGRGIAKHFMLPYNRKIWNTPPAQMGCQWIADRVPVTDVQRVVRNAVTRHDDVSWGPNAMFHYPAKGGTGAVYEALARRLPAEAIRYNTNVVDIDPVAKTITLQDGTRESYETLISTMPIDKLTRMCKMEAEAAAAARLRHTHVRIVGIGLNQPMPENLKEKTWLYLPGDEPYYRLTMHSEFSDDHTPDPANNCSFMGEVSCDLENVYCDSDLKELSLAALQRIVDFDPAEAHVHIIEAPYGYPVPTVDRDQLLGQVQPSLEAKDIYSRGRFGGWKYEAANMDHSIMQGVEVVERLVMGKEEITLPTPDKANAR